jgi:endo-1,3(4)-beta-glucanase
MTSLDIFKNPVSYHPPPAIFTDRSDHPVPRCGIVDQDLPVGTNKFYANFFLGSQACATWTHPYSVAWAKGGGSSGSWGMSVQHVDENQKVFGPDRSFYTVQYVFSPLGIQSLVLSAAELGPATCLTVSSITAFSAHVNLLPSPKALPAITFPLVQGMGFVTGIYKESIPILQTGVFFHSIIPAAQPPKYGVTKYTVKLEDGKTWLVYAYSSVGDRFDLQLVDHKLARSSFKFNGIVQVAKIPIYNDLAEAAERLYDLCCGVYPINIKLSGQAFAATGSYTLSFKKAGQLTASLLMFALPHHVESFCSHTRSLLTSVQLSTTTKGMATAVVGDSWSFLETFPINMGFDPWNIVYRPRSMLSAATTLAIHNVAAIEIEQDLRAQLNMESMYFSGKVISLTRYGTILLLTPSIRL